MRYMGGKTRIAKQIAAVIDQYREPGQLVWDAFCGGLSVSVALSKKGPVLASDACAPLINLYKAVQEGWDPPTEVSKETWQAAKSPPDTDPMKAFCGFGCSFGGKWFAGYAKPCPGKTDPSYAANTLKRDVPGLNIEYIDFLTSSPQPTKSILYLDPPYIGTTEYNGVGIFDYCRFIQKVEQWSKFTDIFVSEYTFKLGKIVFEKEQLTTVPQKRDKPKCAIEKLFYIPKGSL